MMKVFSVKELSQRISKILKENLSAYGPMIIVSGVIKHDKNSKELQLKTSPRFGSYLSFTLIDKDEAKSSVPGYTINVWQGGAQMIDGLQYGVEVQVIGTLTVSSKNSNYYLSAKQIIITDENALKHILAQRKEEFAAKGYFRKSENRYRMDRNPRRIGIVTSRDGSVIHDMLSVLEMRYPLCEVVLYSCGVQGDDSVAMTVANGIRRLDKMGLDAIIVARGGGSAQDLMLFSNEIVVRAMHEAKTYIVSAIGHHDDTPLCDLACNWRSQTPTAAIDDIIVFGRDMLLQWLAGITAYKNYIGSIIAKKRIESAIDINLGSYFEILASRIRVADHIFVTQMFAAMLSGVSYTHSIIGDRCHAKMQELSVLLGSYDARKIHEYCLCYYSNKETYLASVTDVIKAYSYEETLNRGFCLVISKNSKIITSAAELTDTDKTGCVIRFKDGDYGM